jgi:hypothetical protein
MLPRLKAHRTRVELRAHKAPIRGRSTRQLRVNVRSRGARQLLSADDLPHFDHCEALMLDDEGA